MGYGISAVLCYIFWLPRLGIRSASSLLATLASPIWKAWVNHKRRVILSDWQELEFAPEELQSEKETVLAAVRQDWQALEFAASELQGDKEIVGEAVRQNWRALRFASKAVRADGELMAEAVQQSNGWALEYATEELYSTHSSLLREATARLGGRLGLPLAPITTLVPVEVDAEDAGFVISGSALLENSSLPLVAAFNSLEARSRRGQAEASAEAATQELRTASTADQGEEQLRQSEHGREVGEPLMAAVVETDSAEAPLEANIARPEDGREERARAAETRARAAESTDHLETSASAGLAAHMQAEKEDLGLVHHESVIEFPSLASLPPDGLASADSADKAETGDEAETAQAVLSSVAADGREIERMRSGAVQSESGSLGNIVRLQNTGEQAAEETGSCPRAEGRRTGDMLMGRNGSQRSGVDGDDSSRSIVEPEAAVCSRFPSATTRIEDVRQTHQADSSKREQQNFDVKEEFLKRLTEETQHVEHPAPQHLDRQHLPRQELAEVELEEDAHVTEIHSTEPLLESHTSLCRRRSVPVSPSPFV
ncbi:unnamed protein product [Polarella glacialis]|uniref:DUF4116 domain-containing protein n=1 Tax=Polarella glacialis TaxID=89957 RepID=A0A813EMG0_POLGL|nr:unnamed protein product [Polarella glacialis]CAE8655058.1 unnamed protein product [Polarella glacialis]